MIFAQAERMDLIAQARAAAGPEYSRLAQVDVITPEMPYDLGRVLACDPSTGKVLEVSFSSDPDTVPRVRVLPGEEADHVVKSGALDT